MERVRRLIQAALQEVRMTTKNDTAVARQTGPRDPFALLRAEFDRFFGEPAWPAFRWPAFKATALAEGTKWLPEIDVFEKDNRLVTKVDLPGMKKEDVKVEVTDGHLAISGERKTEAEEKKDRFYRCEREYGSFYRVVPLPETVKLEDVKATFADGVLEVSIPLPAKAEPAVKKIEVQDAAPKAAKPAA
jgi:HSP20 family protein